MLKLNQSVETLSSPGAQEQRSPMCRPKILNNSVKRRHRFSVTGTLKVSCQRNTTSKQYEATSLPSVQIPSR